MRVGFIGLGQMGRPIAHNLLRHGAELTVSSGTDRRFAEFRAAGATATMDSADFAAVDIVFLCLPGAEAVRSVLLGESGTGARLGAGQLVVDLSTLPHAATLEIAQALKA